ncbi:hypothetical protein COHA_004020 [Chlorella ohadii]|uniref:Mitochondrial carrier protein n=1 Tax=Chlorella ohadii TaxID=2649997 RepID=A0AAD5DSK8_9CHLO|nr:hypothetical protein COHA_004020 [Chlorella ohadii]
MYEYLKRVLRRWNRKHSNELHVPDAMVASVAGGLAGVCALVAVHPLEAIRTRQALGLRGNFVQAMADVARTEGVPALYKARARWQHCCAASLLDGRPSAMQICAGLDVSVAGVLPYAAIRLASYDAAKGVWRRSTGRKDIDPQAALLFGALAGVVSATATYPLEVLRRRMMAGASQPHVVSLLREMLRHEGPGALFNGVTLTLVKQAPTMAITFAAYEMAKQFLEL